MLSEYFHMCVDNIDDALTYVNDDVLSWECLECGIIFDEAINIYIIDMRCHHCREHSFVIVPDNNKRIDFTDINYFYNINIRTKNGSANIIRELILLSIGKRLVPYEWCIYTKWFDVYKGWINKLNLLCPNGWVLKRTAGRNHHYDFLLSDEKTSYKIEFKYNTKSVDKCPQFLNISSKSFTNFDYAEYFYEYYLNKVADLYLLDLPDKSDYIKNIHKSVPTIQFLKTLKSANDNRHKSIVKDSISTYLANLDHINIDSINTKILETQSGKKYILFHQGQYYCDFLSDEDLTVSDIKCVRNNNVVVLKTLSGYHIEMLLRWKNGIGVLYPAWQISFKRS